MNGDLDVDTMTAVEPIWGPLLYGLFLTSTVFVGQYNSYCILDVSNVVVVVAAFTILIAIISDSYENVKDKVPAQGFFIAAQRKLGGWLAIDVESQPEPEPDAMEVMQQNIIAMQATINDMNLKMNQFMGIQETPKRVTAQNNPLAQDSNIPSLWFVDDTIVHTADMSVQLVNYYPISQSRRTTSSTIILGFLVYQIPLSLCVQIENIINVIMLQL